MKIIKLIALLSIILLIFVACSEKNDTSGDNLVPNPDESLEQPAEDVTEKEVDPIVLQPELPGAFFAMIDNHPKARPQSNLDKADIVYEIVCEGTYTRFLAGFYKTDPVIVGPIRSIRYYFAQIGHAYDTIISHIGGNMDALAYLKNNGLKSMCDITNASGYFERDNTRKMPHNAYVRSSEVIRLSSNRSIELSPLPELNTGEIVGNEKVDKISIDYGTPKYPHMVEWQYISQEEQYVRYLDGEKLLTAEDNEVKTNNIVIIEASVKTVQVPIDGIQSEISLLGKGNAYFLRDGYIYQGSWEKTSASSHFRYTLDDGEEFIFKNGKVWVQQVASFDEDLDIIYSNLEQ